MTSWFAIEVLPAHSPVAGRLACQGHRPAHILSKGLDAGTAYQILSIDIADVDAGDNIGAKLQIDQANADKRIAHAKAEERRATAVAHEQEMKSRVVEAEAEVPLHSALLASLEIRRKLWSSEARHLT